MGHHFVPQRYLRGFESLEREKWIWMFENQSREFKHLPIKQVAQAADFYDEDVEVELNEQVEKPGNRVIDKIRRAEAIDEPARRHLTYYIATMMRRVPRARAKAELNIPDALAQTVQDAKAFVEEAARAGEIDETMRQNRLAEVAVIADKFRQQPPEEVRQVIETPWPFQSMLFAIYRMYWRVLRTKGPSFFLTSDNPASFFEGIGLGHEECEVILPLCTDTLLHCSWQQCQDLESVDLPQRLVREMNRRISGTAERFIFYHKQADWIASVDGSTPQKLNRIRWN